MESINTNTLKYAGNHLAKSTGKTWPGLFRIYEKWCLAHNRPLFICNNPLEWDLQLSNFAFFKFKLDTRVIKANSFKNYRYAIRNAAIKAGKHVVVRIDIVNPILQSVLYHRRKENPDGEGSELITSSIIINYFKLLPINTADNRVWRFYLATCNNTLRRPSELIDTDDPIRFSNLLWDGKNVYPSYKSNGTISNKFVALRLAKSKTNMFRKKQYAIIICLCHASPICAFCELKRVMKTRSKYFPNDFIFILRESGLINYAQASKKLEALNNAIQLQGNHTLHGLRGGGSIDLRKIGASEQSRCAQAYWKSRKTLNHYESKASLQDRAALLASEVAN